MMPRTRTLLAVALLALAPAARPAWSDPPGHGIPPGDPFGPAKRPAGGAPAPTPGDPAPASIESLKPWLAHADWVCRALAARELSHRSEDGVVAILSNALVAEKDARVALFLLKSLAGRARPDLLAEGGPALVDALIPYALDPRSSLRLRALAVLKSMPPWPLGDDPARYAAWWRMGREGVALEARDALDRREASKAASRTGVAPRAPGEVLTTPVADGLDKFRMLDRIHREGLEVVVCLDSTGSMGAVISEAKASMAKLLRRMHSIAPKFRAGLVTYDDGATVRIPLTTNEAAIEAEFKRVEAGGGGDEEEGVDVAVLLALRQERLAWSAKAQRVILVVGDAPPHTDDVDRLLLAIDRARKDVLYEVPVRVDTVSCAFSGDTDADGYVPYFRSIARHGFGTAVKLATASSLAVELMVASFGPEWREPIRELLADVDAFEKEAARLEKKPR